MMVRIPFGPPQKGCAKVIVVSQKHETTITFKRKVVIPSTNAFRLYPTIRERVLSNSSMQLYLNVVPQSKYIYTILSSVTPFVVFNTTSDPFLSGLEALSEAHLNMS